MGPALRLTALVTVVLPAFALGQPMPPAGAPKGHDPNRLSAPITYENLMLVFASDDGVAAVVFTDKIENGIHYKFRYESNDGKQNKTGTGKVFEKYKELLGSKKLGHVLVRDDGGELWFKAGPIEVGWSFGDEGQGHIYYSPEKVRVQIANAKDFDKIDLKRFAK